MQHIVYSNFGSAVGVSSSASRVASLDYEGRQEGCFVWSWETWTRSRGGRARGRNGDWRTQGRAASARSQQALLSTWEVAGLSNLLDLEADRPRRELAPPVASAVAMLTAPSAQDQDQH